MTYKLYIEELGKLKNLVNFLGKMSLEESLDTILGDPHTDKGNQNGIIK